MKKIFEIDGQNYTFETEENIGIDLSLDKKDGDISYYKIKFDFGTMTVPKKVSLSYCMPAIDMYNMWDPQSRVRNLGIRWGKTRTDSRLANGMPIKQLISKSGNNRYLIALSDVKSPLCIAMGASERDGIMDCLVEFFTNITGPFESYEAVMRVDRRDIPFDDAIFEAREWYNTLGYRASVAPAAAKEPMYSTWYSLWQSMTAQQVLYECRHAVKLGMKTVIIDDGWQKAVPGRIYEFVGDWVPERRRFGDLKKLTSKLHEMGLNVMLWFSIAFMGYEAKNHKRFEGKYLSESPSGHYSVLDPRYKEVRDFIVETYVNAVKEYDLDGLKIDFINNFNSNGKVEDGMDFVAVEDATEQLLKDITAALNALKPNMLIEFRQPYFGPVISSYGNMIRVWDCPLDSVVNKNSAIDLRLTSSTCAVHSDMIYWSEQDTPENVAIQLWGTMFAVPQISNNYDKTTPAQREVLKNYLDFWMAHKDTLMDGRLNVKLEGYGYGYATARGKNEKISLAVSTPIADATEDFESTYLVNITSSGSVIVKASKGDGVEIFDCCGKKVGRKKKLTGTLTEHTVPIGGMIKITKA
ncbi:MAG: alpha-galactosidase [Clostridia bacterium]|nr:alpha-galactosidase [Clostridia bacterium]